MLGVWEWGFSMARKSGRWGGLVSRSRFNKVSACMTKVIVFCHSTTLILIVTQLFEL